MDNDFLLKNRDEQILGNYLKLLAFTAQEKDSNHAFMALRLENFELKENIKKLQDENNDLVNHHLDNLFNSDDAVIQAELNVKIQKYLLNKTATGAKSLYKNGVGKISTIFKEKVK